MNYSKSHLLLLLTLFFACAAQECAAEPVAKSATVQALCFDQEHYYLGATRLTVSELGLRLDGDKKQNFVVVARPPQWKVTVYRTDDKTYCLQNFKTFREAGLVTGLLMDFKEHFIMKGSVPRIVDIQGFKAQRLRSQKFEIDYLLMPEDVPRRAELLIYALYKLPTQGGIPLRYQTNSIRRDFIIEGSAKFSSRVYLKTNKITRKTVSESLFEPPANYRRVKYMGAVVVNRERRNRGADLEGLMRESYQPTGLVQPQPQSGK